MRLIDADLLEKVDFSECADSMEIMAIIDEQPTADVKPVVRGHWSNDDYCNRCNHNLYELVHFTEDGSIEQPDFCPFCGADMRGI